MFAVLISLSKIKINLSKSSSSFHVKWLGYVVSEDDNDVDGTGTGRRRSGEMKEVNDTKKLFVLFLSHFYLLLDTSSTSMYKARASLHALSLFSI